MGQKRTIWYFSQTASDQNLFDEFFKQHPEFPFRVTGDYGWFGDIIQEAEKIAVLIIDTYRLSVSDLKAIIERVNIVAKSVDKERPPIFNGEIFFVSTTADELEAVKSLSQQGIYKTPKNIQFLLSGLLL